MNDQPAISFAPSDAALLQALFQATPDALLVLDADGVLVLANQRAAHLFGYDSGGLPGQPITTLLPGYDSPNPGAAPTSRTLIATRADGTSFPADISTSAVPITTRALEVCVVRDISAQQQFEAELRASQARLAGVLEIAEDAIISVNEAQQIQRFNHGAEKIFGYAAHEVLGQPLDVLLPPRFRAIHRQHLVHFAATPEHARRMGERREIFGWRKDQTEFPAEASISKLTVGGETVFTVFLRDITERKQAAHELERQVQRRTAHLDTLLAFSKELFGARGLDTVLGRALRHALALVPDATHGAIYLAGGDDRLALRASHGFSPLPDLHLPPHPGLINEAFGSRTLRIANSAAEWSAGSNPALDAALALSDAPTGALALPLVAYDQAVGVVLLLRDDGVGPFAADALVTLAGLANLTAAAILEERSQTATATLSSQVAHLEAQQQALTERLTHAEAGMLQAARLAAVGQLAASIAHEINNPLYAARNSLFLLSEDLPPELADSSYLALASQQLDRIARIIERMRDFYRPTRGELAEHDLNQLLEETLALAGLNLRHGTVNMIFTPALDLPRALCNGDQLRQVFLNLVLNAIEAMPDGGTLTVRTERGPTVAVIEIQDTGVGIPDEVRSHLFEPFWTNKPNGTGLGLSISAHIVTQHGGQIEVESVVDQGSTFRVVLPYRQTTT
jgi:two-component system, NtrC family, sensor kinase